MPFKIYYLDDEPDLLEIFVEQFSSAEISVSTFTDPVQAVKVILQSPPDLLILDYRLCGTTGDQVAQSVSQEIAKILITGDLEFIPKSQFLKIFRKPFYLNDLQKFIAGRLLLKM